MSNTWRVEDRCSYTSSAHCTGMMRRHGTCTALISAMLAVWAALTGGCTAFSPAGAGCVHCIGLSADATNPSDPPLQQVCQVFINLLVVKSFFGLFFKT